MGKPHQPVSIKRRIVVHEVSTDLKTILPNHDSLT